MSLKSRLRISIVTLVTLFVLAQCLVSLQLSAKRDFENAADRAVSIAIQTQAQVTARVNEQARMVTPPPPTIEEQKHLWYSLVENDQALPELLEKALDPSAVVEILVCDENGRILAASSPEPRTRVTYASLPDFTEWRFRPVWERLLEVVFTASKDYVLVRPIGLQDPDNKGALNPILSIRVVVSSVLIRGVVLPQVEILAVVSTLTLLASIILAYLFSNVMLRSLARLDQRIESIATGQFTGDPQSLAKEGKEFAAIQSKLDVLSQQFRGAKDDVVQLRSNIERLLEGLEEALLLFDTEHRLVRTSRSAEALLSSGGDTMAGKTITELFPVTTPLGALLYDAIAGQHGVRDAIAELHRPPEPPLRVLVNVELLESYPEPGRFSVLITLRDAERRREIRSQLDISTRLTAISRLTGGVAHEIKNPLNAIALHLEILRSRIVDNGEVQKTVDVIGSEIARLDRVVKTFLDFTRPVELRLKEIDMVELARQVAALVWPQAERSQVSVELESAYRTANIRGDEDLLKQALLNIVNNGIEAMKLGGRLRISIERDRGEVLVTISDQGGGIPEDLRDRIFNLYFSTKEKGSGIGLAMTFRIIQLHNASIEFTSKAGAGTTFYLRFPVDDSATAELNPGRESHSHLVSASAGEVHR